MNKAVRKFVWSAEGAIFILITVLLSVMNLMDFAMAGDDADHMTQMIADRMGEFRQDTKPPEERRNGSFRFKNFEMMGPDSPEMNKSLRYFTISFDKDGNADVVSFKMSAVNESEAESWAKSLLDKETGWTNVNYRYRVYERDKKTYVTVIDQGRELLASYRMLAISAAGEVLVLILSFIILNIAGKRIFRPIEESDRKQKQFISNVEKEFSVPLTVINANTELIERKHGPDDTTNTINKQVRRMTAIVRDMSDFSVFEEEDKNVSVVRLSDMLRRVIDSRTADFEEKKIQLVCDIEDNIELRGDNNRIKKSISEMVDNAVKFANKDVLFSLKKEKNRILLRQENDTALKDGSCDQVFDRFTMLENAKGTDGIGLGLSYVKQTVLAHDGRVSAKVADGRFILQVAL